MLIGLGLLELDFLKRLYPSGTRFQLLGTNNPDNDVFEGTFGTINHIDDEGIIHVDWDKGFAGTMQISIDKFYTM